MSDYVDSGPNGASRHKHRTVAVLMVILVLLGGALVASAPLDLGDGGFAPFLGAATGGAITLVRAWELGRPTGEFKVLTTRRWKLLLFTLLAITFGCYAVWAAVIHRNSFAPGMSLMMAALLMGTLLFDPGPRIRNKPEGPTRG